MTPTLLNDRDMEFLLFDVLDTDSLTSRPRYAEHSKETFQLILKTAKDIANREFANHYQKADANEPTFDGQQVTQPPEVKQAWDAFAEAGFLAAHYDAEDGGSQLPEVILRAAMAYFNAANISTTAYPFLTIGAANLIHTFGSEQQRQTFLEGMQTGRFAGTMALTEPGQGSSLADIRTRATRLDNGEYRLFGQKMFISGGDQSLTENIVHMVLARADDAPPGIGGISLFICPKFLVEADGQLGPRNDVALAGLLHKMGYRGTTSTVLNFGERDGATAYLVGEEGKGLRYMFQMMNEARIGVALGAASLAYQGYNLSLAYAKERRQGRLPSNKAPDSDQVALIEHADVRRMLLAQKVYAEGALALCLYASMLTEDSQTETNAERRHEAGLLLDFLTPVVKSWASKYGVQSNDLAIQVLGGSGYVREYAAEQLYRDNRLNPIHEGTEGIHGIDLLGRKLPMRNGEAYAIFRNHVADVSARCCKHPRLAPLAHSLEDALACLDDVNQALLPHLQDRSDLALANASIYLDLVGRVTASWIWMRQALAAEQALKAPALSEGDRDFYQGKLSAAQYMIQWELPGIYPQANILKGLDRTAYDMHPNYF